MALEPRVFGALPGEDGYFLSWIEKSVKLEVRHLRRHSHELIGELRALCDWPGAKTFQGSLLTADFNFSGESARKTRAKSLQERSLADEKDFDWRSFLEEFVVRVIQAERAGLPPIRLEEAADLDPDHDVTVLGLSLPLSEPAVIQADGGSLKSLLALYIAGTLVQQGRSVLYLDSEWTAPQHKGRLRRLFGPAPMPGLIYARAVGPLTQDISRIRKIVADYGISYIILDSVLLFLDGPPEAAEVAQRYFRAIAQIGVGSLSLAHISHQSANDVASTGPAKAFGSRFFHNLARRSWMLRKQEEDSSNCVIVGAYPDKRNEGKARDAVGIEVIFDPHVIRVSPVNLTASVELSERLPMRQRLQQALTRGEKSQALLAEELGVSAAAIHKAVIRRPDLFQTRRTGAQEAIVGLVADRAEPEGF